MHIHTVSGGTSTFGGWRASRSENVEPGLSDAQLNMWHVM